MVVANYKVATHEKILKMMVMATFFASFIAWHNCSIATHFFQEFDGDDDDYDYYDDDYENLSGDASII